MCNIRKEESAVTPSHPLDDSVIFLSPPPVKEPSYVDISDDFQVNKINKNKHLFIYLSHYYLVVVSKKLI